MGNKITIIGAGSVGSTITHILSLEDFVSELVMIDILKDKADGEVMDMVQGVGFRDPVRMISGEYEDARGSDIVIITSGVARKPGQTRLELARTNVNIIKSIAPQISAVAPDAMYIMVANPVDILTYAFIQYSSIPEHKVVGSGTLLDSIRLRYKLSETLDIAQKNIQGYVFGEHGDTSFIPWSMVRVEGIAIDDYTNDARKLGKMVNDFSKEDVAEYVRKSGGEIIKRKGATYYGVSNSVVNLVRELLSAQDVVTVASSMMHGEYGVTDVCTSCMTVLGPHGVKGKLETNITPEEKELFLASCNALKSVIAGLEIPKRV